MTSSNINTITNNISVIIKKTSLSYFDSPKNKINNNNNNILTENSNILQTNKLPRLPDRSLTTRNYGAAPNMQRGNYNNVHQRCDDFIIEIEPYSYSPVAFGGCNLSYNTGGTSTMTTTMSPHSSTALMNSTNSPSSISDGQSLSMITANRLRDFESHIHYQSEQLKSILWERDDLKYRNNNLEVQVKKMREQLNYFDKLFKERENLKMQNESLHNNLKQLQSIVVQSNKERDDTRGKYQLLELYIKALRLRKQNDNLAAGMGRLQDELNFFIKQRDELSSENLLLISKSDLILNKSDQIQQQNSELVLELENQQKEYEKLREQRDEVKLQNYTLISENDRLQNQLTKYLNEMLILRQSDSTASVSTVSEFANSEFGDEDEDCQSITTVTSIEQLEQQENKEHTDAKLGIINQYDDISTSSELIRKNNYELLEKLHNQLDTIILQRDYLLNENSSLKSQLENLQKERNDILSKNDSLNSQHEQLKTECIQIRQHRDELSSQNDLIKSDNYSLITQLENQQSECNLICERRDELDKDLKDAMANNNNLILQMEKFQIDIDTISKDNYELKNKNTLETSKLFQLQTELSTLTQKNEKLSNEKNSLTSQLEQTRIDYDQQQGKLLSKNSMISSQLVQLQEELNAFRQNYDESEINNNILRSQIKQLQTELEQMSLNRDENNHLRERELKKLQDYDSIMNERDELKNQMALLISQNEQLKEGNNNLNCQRDVESNQDIEIEIIRKKSETTTVATNSPRQSMYITQPISKRASLYNDKSYEDSGIFVSRQVSPVPTQYNIISGQYYEDQNNNRRTSLYNRYSKKMSQESLRSLASTTSNMAPSVHTIGSTNVSRRSSMYNVTKPLPSIPGKEQTSPTKSSSATNDTLSKKSIKLSGRLSGSLRNKSQKPIPTCQHCEQRPCKKNFTGYSKYCSSNCRSLAKQEELISSLYPELTVYPSHITARFIFYRYLV
ncbi:9581_t:CDS:2 [Diversispora eburnea]|uniref:9581_t:CDS:1 n=1 Tax=Diversispora eburnea TaxID=1213867 RepID=A0A9N8YM94_9GLOM|nr:9581_t:CDS:2 [Diversispora eburnea]